MGLGPQSLERIDWYLALAGKATSGVGRTEDVVEQLAAVFVGVESILDIGRQSRVHMSGDQSGFSSSHSRALGHVPVVKLAIKG